VRDAGILKGTTYFEAGSRLPPAPVERLADWRPLDLQDLAPSDGLFKIFIFPGDILVEADLLRLQEFCDALMTFPHMANLFGSRVILYTILNSERKKAEWVDVPSLLRDWKRFVVILISTRTLVTCAPQGVRFQ
jgi:phenol 2-monooxygenase